MDRAGSSMQHDAPNRGKRGAGGSGGLARAIRAGIPGSGMRDYIASFASLAVILIWCPWWVTAGVLGLCWWLGRCSRLEAEAAARARLNVELLAKSVLSPNSPSVPGEQGESTSSPADSPAPRTADWTVHAAPAGDDQTWEGPSNPTSFPERPEWPQTRFESGLD